MNNWAYFLKDNSYFLNNKSLLQYLTSVDTCLVFFFPEEVILCINFLVKPGVYIYNRVHIVAVGESANWFMWISDV